MYSFLRRIYGRLLMVPGIGPWFRLPVLTWRAIFGRVGRLGWTARSYKDMLLLALAAIDGLRADARQLRVRIDEATAEVEDRLRQEIAEASRRQAAERDAAVVEAERRLRERIEFVRVETMFELNARLAARGTGPVIAGERSDRTVARIKAPEKVGALAAAGGLRLNVGCGHLPLEGHVNVDRRDLPGVDVIADADAMPFDPGTISEIFAAHLLEHFPREHVRRVVLPHWRSLLRSGGTLRVVVPDAEAMLAEYAAGRMSFAELSEVTFGLQEYEGDFHFAMFSREDLTALLREAGFVDVGFVDQARRNGKCLEMEVSGVAA